MPVAVLSGRSPRRRARPLSQAAAAARRNLPGSPPRTDPGHCQQRPGHAREDQDDLNDVHVQAVRVSRRDARAWARTGRDHDRALVAEVPVMARRVIAELPPGGGAAETGNLSRAGCRRLRRAGTGPGHPPGPGSNRRVPAPDRGDPGRSHGAVPARPGPFSASHPGDGLILAGTAARLPGGRRQHAGIDQATGMPTGQPCTGIAEVLIRLRLRRACGRALAGLARGIVARRSWAASWPRLVRGRPGVRDSGHQRAYRAPRGICCLS
jgi:hypothetical protein